MNHNFVILKDLSCWTSTIPTRNSVRLQFGIPRLDGLTPS